MARIDAGFYLKMETKNDLMLDETQHRLVMCCRMAKALGKGEVFLDLTTPRMCWRIEKNDKVLQTFHSIDDMEEFLENLLEKRYRTNFMRSQLEPQVARRLNVVEIRKNMRTTGAPMTFHSKVNTL